MGQFFKPDPPTRRLAYGPKVIRSPVSEDEGGNHFLMLCVYGTASKALRAFQEAGFFLLDGHELQAYGGGDIECLLRSG